MCTCTSKSTLAGRGATVIVTQLAFLLIDVTIRHQIAGVKQAANHLGTSPPAAVV